MRIGYMEKNSYKIKKGPFRAPMAKIIHLRKRELIYICVIHSIRVNSKLTIVKIFLNKDDQRRTT